MEPGKTAEPLMKDAQNSEERAYDRKFPRGTDWASSMTSVAAVESCMLGDLIQLRGNRMELKKEAKGSLCSRSKNSLGSSVLHPAPAYDSSEVSFFFP